MTTVKKIKKATEPNWFYIDGKWHHCIVVVKNGKSKHYVDGEFNHETQEKILI